MSRSPWIIILRDKPYQKMNQGFKLQLFKQTLAISRKQRFMMHYKTCAKNNNYQTKIKPVQYMKPNTFSNDNKF